MASEDDKYWVARLTVCSPGRGFDKFKVAKYPLDLASRKNYPPSGIYRGARSLKGNRFSDTTQQTGTCFFFFI